MPDGEWSPGAVRGETMELPIYRAAPRVPGRVFLGADAQWRLLVVRLLVADLVVSGLALLVVLALALS